MLKQQTINNPKRKTGADIVRDDKLERRLDTVQEGLGLLVAQTIGGALEVSLFCEEEG